MSFPVAPNPVGWRFAGKGKAARTSRVESDGLYLSKGSTGQVDSFNLSHVARAAAGTHLDPQLSLAELGNGVILQHESAVWLYRVALVGRHASVL